MKKLSCILTNTDEKKNYAAAIVLIGDFSPTMFQPYWFKHFNIISDDECSSIDEKTMVVVEPITTFQTNNFVFSIELKRFIITAKREPFELLLDLFEKLKIYMEFSIIRHFGINFSYHIELKNLENMKKFGDVIAPKKYWNSFLDADEINEEKNGLRAMEMTKKTDFGFANVRVEASAFFKYALFFNYNYHFNGDKNKPFDMVDVNDILKEKFFNLAQYSNNISNKLIGAALKL